MYLSPPSSRDVPYNLTKLFYKIIPGDWNDKSDTEAMRVLKNKVRFYRNLKKLRLMK